MSIKQKTYSKVMTIKVEPDLLKKFKDIVGYKNVSNTIREFMKKTIKQEKKERFID
ncbi:MAG TPA: hypothetical protein PL110_04155 [Candidatus Eremiobacteraeota bacterium]|nr:MAG: hypothetical protein BWY64_01619 [bacterium ADurb.Bin363]HPZ07281.1 hypothetical protein [Candidatus Eremiobacteraeota bacterium]